MYKKGHTVNIIRKLTSQSNDQPNNSRTIKKQIYKNSYEMLQIKNTHYSNHQKIF